MNNRAPHENPASCPAGSLAEVQRQLFLFAEINLDIPVFNLHSAVSLQIEVHLEGAVPELRLVTNLTPEAVGSGYIQILGQLCLVVRMSALFNDVSGAGLRIHPAHVGQTLLGDDDVEIVLGVVNVRAVRYNAGNTRRVGLARTA